MVEVVFKVEVFIDDWFSATLEIIEIRDLMHVNEQGMLKCAESVFNESVD